MSAMRSAEVTRLIDAVLDLDADDRARLIGRIIGHLSGGDTLDADEFRRQLVEVGKPTPTPPRLDLSQRPSARPSSQAGLASFVHLRSEPGATRTGS